MNVSLQYFERLCRFNRPFGMRWLLPGILLFLSCVYIEAQQTPLKVLILSLIHICRELQRAYGQESQVALTTPILEGLDGVQKMSKSLGNAIGIHEPSLEMYGKVMSISDEMMWRYYELLTDVQLAEIEKMKSGMHPMQAKKELAQRIVADFHSTEAAAKAGEDWGKQFQKSELPESVEEAAIDVPENRLRIDKLLARARLAESVTDAGRMVKQGAVRAVSYTHLDVYKRQLIDTSYNHH